MGDTLKITHGQGNMLLNGAVGNKFPASVGERKFNEGAQAKINEKFRLLGKLMKKAATKKDGRFMFGVFSNWKPIELKTSKMDAGGSIEMVDVQKETIYNLIDQDLEYELADVTGAAKSGIYWLCYLWSNPSSPICQNPGFQDEVVWPLVEMIGKAGALRTDIGLKDEGDDEYFGEEKGEVGKVLQMPKKEPANAEA